ncbi:MULTISPECIES: Gfo/Idh/MocA family protein [unclassified Paenibacillus]|uniref:Gfo/Idh/MocA family protein n=1 Tax=unclassified Paenibacillus TaxID=185978 RepID=UPI00096F81D3|nr:Gfo/Idh/MocA family oxidoreductase [Paenibacillus sp. FSL H8-0259]OMF28157.1 oxidoreductase [Paenibacillus sp. FSL H8-0259]
MGKIRIGIIGVGGMGTSHAQSIMSGKVLNAELAAVCDVRAERLDWVKQSYGDKVKLYDNKDAFFKSNQFDAVLIATPHYDHPVLAIQALRSGYHTLIEKPAGVYTKAVREMNEAAQQSNKVFSIMYNQRTNPVYQKLKDLIDSGELGELKRSIWIITNWYRSQSYYDAGGWRATWSGEGGGVLLNQDPHQLDLWQWICGMPTKVRAFMSYGKYHNIEVEDDVTAYVEYANGATGLFVTTTGEAPGTNRLEVTGDRGKIVIEDDKLTFWRLRMPERKFNSEYKGGFGSPECWKCEIPTPGENTQHVGIINNWVDAILNGTELLAPGIEGIKGLTISNAMHLSAWTDLSVELPLNEELFFEKLKTRIDNSTFKKSVTEGTLDVSGTH